jgi:hypothetical protein
VEQVMNAGDHRRQLAADLARSEDLVDGRHH